MFKAVVFCAKVQSSVLIMVMLYTVGLVRFSFMLVLMLVLHFLSELIVALGIAYCLVNLCITVRCL